MTRQHHAPIGEHLTARWLRALQARLRDPAVLAIVAVAFFISALGQAVLQASIDDDSVVTTAVLSVFGSVFVAAAIIIAARRHDRTTRNPRPPSRDVR